jgi:hypothetical protein
METLRNGKLIPAACDTAEKVSYAGAGGRCKYRIKLVHCLYHFERRLTAGEKVVEYFDWLGVLSPSKSDCCLGCIVQVVVTLHTGYK